MLGIDKELETTFPGLGVIELRMDDIKVKKIDRELEQLKQDIQTKIRIRVGSLDDVKNQPIFRAYRDFFWRVGIDPTKTRPAGEALTRRILGGKDLPTINTLVDAYNLVSVETSIAIAAFDLARIDPHALRMRKARSGEEFRGIGMDSPISLKGVEIVIEDAPSDRLIAIYPYRDSDDSKVTENSKNVLLMMCGVPGIDRQDLENANSLTKQYVERFCTLRTNSSMDASP